MDYRRCERIRLDSVLGWNLTGLTKKNYEETVELGIAPLQVTNLFPELICSVTDIWQLAMAGYSVENPVLFEGI
jgi:hypothetical protein